MDKSIKGQKVRVVGVRFVSGVKVYYFDPGQLQLKRGDYVVVDSQQGEELAKVIYELVEMERDEIEEELLSIVRLASDDDKKKTIDFFRSRKKYVDEADVLARDLKLSIHILDVSQSLDKTRRLLFLFAAEGRVDFRELLNKMTKKFGCPIRLYQVGPRDAARIIGGVGVCGQELCCSRFLNKFESITMEMAREQDLINLGSNKISGVCGKLLCCMAYELKLYETLRREMPGIGLYVQNNEGETGYIIERNILAQTVVVELEKSSLRKTIPLEEIKVLKK